MNRARPRRAKALLGAACCIALLGNSAPAGAEPIIPANDGIVVETLPNTAGRSSQELRRLTAALNRAPDLLDLAVKVAQKNIELGQSEADPRYDGRAEAALAPWIALPDPPPPVRLIRAILHQRVHDFPGALRDLDALLQNDPGHRQARLIRATIHQVRGDFSEALADCRELGPATDRVVAICLASVHSVTGSAARSLEELRAADSGAFTTQELPTRLWGLTVAAETAARLGCAETAEGSYRTALALGLRDPYLLASYADFLLDQNRPGEVDALLRAESRVDPLLLRLALAERALRRASLDGHVADLAERFTAARRRGDTAHRREESRFTLSLLDQPKQALALARDNWAVQREPADTRLFLDSAIAARAPAPALPVVEWVRRTGLEYDAVTADISRLSEAAP